MCPWCAHSSAVAAHQGIMLRLRRCAPRAFDSLPFLQLARANPGPKRCCLSKLAVLVLMCVCVCFLCDQAAIVLCYFVARLFVHLTCLNNYRVANAARKEYQRRMNTGEIACRYNEVLPHHAATKPVLKVTTQFEGFLFA